MSQGFDKAGFMEYLENTFHGFEHAFLRETVENIVDYGLKEHNYSLDQLCYFLSDMLPGVEFKNVAFYMDDEHLTQHGRACKREAERELDDKLKRYPWLDDLVRDAVLSSNPIDPVKAEKNLKEIFESLPQCKGAGAPDRDDR